MARSVNSNEQENPTPDASGPVLITLTQEQFATLLQGRQSSPAITKPARPSISLDASDEDWRLFLFQWGRYKDITGTESEHALRNELLSSCSPELEKQLFHLKGDSLNVLNETDLLAQIKAVAVRGLHTTVHRSQFHALRQTQGEDITHYVARLRSKAALCDFSVPAYRPHPDSNQPGPVSYEDDILQTQMIVGLCNTDHQSRLLAAADRYPTFTKKCQALQAMQVAMPCIG